MVKIVALFIALLNVFARSMSISVQKSPILLRNIPWQPLAEHQTSLVLEKSNPQIPLWPIWGGMLTQLTERAGFKKISDKIWSSVGGRIVPTQFVDKSPFIMLAHHAHSFSLFDPFRSTLEYIIPEGYPAHPHAGFDHVTYCLEGGIRHRDSEGFKASYGNGQVQWMRTGRGVIHEEMWDLPVVHIGNHRIELFQLWVNIPKSIKQSPPSTHILQTNDIPVCSFLNNRAQVKIICGSFADDQQEAVQSQGSEIAASPVGIFHLSCSNNSQLHLQIDNAPTAVLYVRKGSLSLADGTVAQSGDVVAASALDAAGSCTVRVTAGSTSGFDGLLLSGQDLQEPVVLKDNFVQADEKEIQRIESMFASLGASASWKYNMDDNAWRKHCQKLQLQKVIGAMQEGS